MFKSFNSRTILRSCAALALVCGVGLSVELGSAGTARSNAPAVQPVSFDATWGAVATEDTDARTAISRFITAMASGDAKKVWSFASEEDQDAFGTEDAVYAAFGETFPAFQRARKVIFIGFTQEGDTPIVKLAMTEASGAKWDATVGLWRDDAGDWKIVSCDLQPESQGMV